MRVWTLATIETPRGEVPAGKIITIPDEAFEQLRGKVEVVTDGRDKITYCPTTGCWCLARLPPEMDPTACQHCEPRGEP